MTEQKVLGMELDMKISIGNVITIGIVLVSVVGAYYQNKGNTDKAIENSARLEIRIDRLETQNSDGRDRMTRMEVTLQNMAINIDRVARFFDGGSTPVTPQNFNRPTPIPR